MNYLNVLLALGGWIVAGIQFLLSIRETRRKHEAELLEKTLGYFADGPVKRSIGISLVQSIWTKNERQLPVIIPVLVAQLNYLLLEAHTESRVEERNLIRILDLLRHYVDKSSDPQTERIEIMEALNAKLHALDRGVPATPYQLKLWYTSFGGDAEYFDAETDGAQPCASDRSPHSAG
jgi:hypothetical protein